MEVAEVVLPSDLMVPCYGAALDVNRCENVRAASQCNPRHPREEYNGLALLAQPNEPPQRFLLLLASVFLKGGSV